MLLTKFSTLQIIHTAGTNLFVADKLSREFSNITNKMFQLQHKTLPPHIDFLHLKSDKDLKPFHFLVEHEDALSAQKNNSRHIFVDYGQFTLRIQIKGNTVMINPLESVSFHSVSSFLTK